ncbi:hypothetical protein D9M72_501060 [compost metagenome]
MLPLRGQRAVLGHDGPAVGQLLRFGAARVEHRLDGEDHARLEHEARPAPPEVQHLRFVVVDAADAVPAVFAHHAEVLALRDRLDRVAHVAQRRAGLHLADAGAQGFVGRLHQPARQHAGRTDEEHAAGVAEPAVLVDGDVDVDDVARLQDLVGRGNAVAHHLVHRGEDGLRIAQVAHVGGNGALHLHDVCVAEAVERFGAHAGHDVGLDHRQDLGGQLCGAPRHHQLFGGLEWNVVCHHQCLPFAGARGLPGGAAVTVAAMSSPPESSAWISSWQTSR